MSALPPGYGFDTFSGAEFSADRKHRFLLWRIWSPAPGRLLGFVMLNPSTADETRDDPTTVRNMARARMMGYAGIVQANLYSFRTPSPAKLKAEGYPGGPRGENALYLARLADRCRDIVCAWGAHARLTDALDAVRHLKGLPQTPRLLHLGFLKAQGPGGRRYNSAMSDVLVRHPLMTAYGEPPNYGLQEWT